MKEIKNYQEYQELIDSGKPILLDFYADWCGPCQVLLPIVDKISKRYENEVNVRKVNVDVFADLAKDFQVRSIPALFLIEEGKVTEKLVGVQTDSALDNLLHKATVGV